MTWVIQILCTETLIIAAFDCVFFIAIVKDCPEIELIFGT